MRNAPLKAFASPVKGKKDACYHKVKASADEWPSAYASGWGVRCTKAGGPRNMGKKKKK